MVHQADWNKTKYTTSTTLAQAGFTCAPRPNDTMLQALRYKGGSTLNDKKNLLIKQAVAALLDASHPDVNYPLTETDILNLVNPLLCGGTEDQILSAQNELNAFNNLGCPLSNVMIAGSPVPTASSSGTNWSMSTVSGTTTTSHPASTPTDATDSLADVKLGAIPTAALSAAPAAEKEMSRITSVELTGNQVEVKGRVVDSSGAPLAGVVGVTIAFYSSRDSSASVWLENRNIEPDKEGRYIVRTTLPTELSLPAHWLGVQVQGQAEQARVALR